MSSSKINPGSRIILGIDIGTTYSAVSFTYRSEKVHHVSEWPGQEAQPGECKVPSLVCYDDQDKPVCFGSEAINLEVLNETTAKGWTLVRCFKRHNYPPSTARGSFILESLPFSVSLSTVYTDYLRYLLSHTESYFTNHVINGRSLWTEQSSDMLIALAHPNSWPLSNQRLLEHAVCSLGGAYQDCEIQFITESEASLHFCIASSNISWTLQPGTIFTVCDAGGSSFEINTYYIEKSSPAFAVKKLANEYFTQAGGASVDLECRRYLTQKLRSSRLSQADVRDYVEYGVRDFSSRVKVQFSSSQSSFHIKLSEANFTEPSLGIKSGSICLSGPTIESFFNPYVSFLVELLRQQASKLKSKHILLVGGSGKSLYLRRKLSNEVLSYDCQVLVMDDFFVKAVADGAVIGMTNAAVVTPSTQLSYGTMVRVRYDPSNPEHQGRKVTRGHGGYDGIVGRWSELLGAGIILSAHTVIRHKFIKSYKPEQNAYNDLNWYTDDIWAFHGESRSNAGWVEDTNGGINPGFEKLCQVEANLSSMRHQLQRKEGPDGVYDILEFFLVIQSSGPDLCAYFEWEEKGVSRRGPITVIPKLVDLCEKSSKLPSNNCY